MRRGPVERAPVRSQPDIEFDQPLRIDEAFQDTSHSKGGRSGLELAQRFELDDLVDVGVDLIDQAYFVTTIRQEQAYRFDDGVALLVQLRKSGGWVGVVAAADLLE
jgi:hypothetical protein